MRPSLNTIEPFASLNARWAEMTRREDELMAELRPLVAEIRAAGGYAERGGVPVRPAAGPDGYRPGVARIGCRPGAVPPAGPGAGQRPRPPEGTSGRDQYRAGQYHGGETAPLAGAEPGARRGLRQGLRRVRPAHAAIAQRIAAALTELGEAGTPRPCFFTELAAEGCSTSTLRQIVIHDLDDPLDTIGRALHWAAECGYIDLNALPPEWLAR